MASKRMISNRVHHSKKLAQISYQAEVFYYRALPALDDAGRLTADPEEYRARVIPMGKRGRQVPLSQVQSCLDELYQVGLIGICQCPGKKCQEYTRFSDFQTLKGDRMPQIDCLEPIGFQMFPDGALIEVNRSKENICSTEGSSFQTEFEKWYSGYPRKGGKVDAFKAFAARLNDGHTLADLTTARNNYTAVIRRDGTEQKFIKLAKTFLGPGGHIDEYLTPLPPTCGSCTHGGPEPRYCLEVDQTVTPERKACKAHKEAPIA